MEMAKQYRPSAIFSALFALLYFTNAKEVDSITLATIRQQIRNKITSDTTLLGGLVRLSFHDCVGNRCDGCINTLNQDNAGLKTYIDMMEPLYQSITSGGVELSRADFWAIAGTEAVYVGAENARRPRGCRRFCPPKPVPDIKFYTGRKDCNSSVPVGSPWTTDMHEFPSAHWNTEKVLEYFNKTFGFDAKETTAIMGAHRLGSANARNSGFRHPWVERNRILDNEFFKHVQDPSVGWHQTTTGTGQPVSGIRPRGPRQLQYMWITGDDQLRPTIMLNSDMALIKDLGNMTTMGRVSCEYEKCPDTKSDTLAWTKQYSQDNELFLHEFSKAFQKMIMNGYSYTDLTLVQSS